MSYGNPSLSEMAEDVYAVNVANGWFEEDRTFGDDIALITTEVGEAYDAFHNWGLTDMTSSLLQSKPEGVGSELADILIRVLDTAKRRGFNLDYEYRRKLEYNKTRGYKYGGKVI
jgi:NTP pyrophosphatase (non-canonical NTP hydrolase)